MKRLSQGQAPALPAPDATPREARPADLFPTCEEVAAAVAAAREEADRKRAEKVAAYEEKVRAWRAALVAKSDADRGKKAAERDRKMASTPDIDVEAWLDGMAEIAEGATLVPSSGIVNLADPGRLFAAPLD